MSKHYPHKYMHGKQTKSINFSTFKTMMDTGIFKKRMHKSFLGFLYWTGVRISEAFRAKDGQFSKGAKYWDGRFDAFDEILKYCFPKGGIGTE